MACFVEKWCGLPQYSTAMAQISGGTLQVSMCVGLGSGIVWDGSIVMQIGRLGDAWGRNSVERSTAKHTTTKAHHICSNRSCHVQSCHVATMRTFLPKVCCRKA